MSEEHDEWVTATIGYAESEIEKLRDMRASLIRQIALCERLLASVDSWYEVQPSDFQTIFRRLFPQLVLDVQNLLDLHKANRYARFQGVTRSFRPIQESIASIESAWDSRSQDNRVLAALEGMGPGIRESIIQFLEGLITTQMEHICDGLDWFEKACGSLQRDIANRDWYRLQPQGDTPNLDRIFSLGVRSAPNAAFMDGFIKAVSEHLCARVLDPTDSLKWAVEQAFGIDEKQIRGLLAADSFEFDRSSLEDLRFLIVKLLYAYGRRTKTANLSERIADELNISKRTVERVAADNSRTFEDVVAARLDLAEIAYEVYRSIVRPRTVVNRTELDSDYLTKMQTVTSRWFTTGERPRFPKKTRREHAIRILRNSIASLAKLKDPIDLTLEDARRVLGNDAPNTITLEEFLEVLVDRDSGRIQETTQQTRKIGLIGRNVVKRTSNHPIPIAEIDARLEAEVLALNEDDTERYIRGQLEPDQTAIDIHDRVQRLALEFGPGTDVATGLMGYEIEDIESRIEEWNRYDPRKRRGLVLADFFSVPRQLRLQLILQKGKSPKKIVEDRKQKGKLKLRHGRSKSVKPSGRRADDEHKSGLA